MTRVSRRHAAGLGLLAAMFASAPMVPGQERQVAATSARVLGVVYDSIAMRPLVGALVQLALVPSPGTITTVRSISTDTLGRFDFPDVAPGTYLMGFQHVAADSLGLRSPLQRIDVRNASAIRATLAVPSMRSIIRAVCGRDGASDSLAVLLGSVRHARSDVSLPGAFVSVRWGEVLLGGGGTMQRTTPIVDAFANDEGWFTACVPGDVPVTVRATHRNDLSGNVEIGVPSHAVLRRDIYVGAADAEVRSDSSPSGQPRGERIVERGRGALRGIVRGLDGAPIAGARVAMVSGVGETRTNARGEFLLEGLPYGTHAIEARAIGYMPGQEIADIVEFRQPDAQFVLLDVSAYLLDTVRIAAARQLEAAERAGFERRRRSGTGYFLDESVLDTMKANTFRDLVRRVPGVRFTRGNSIADTWREYVEFTSGQAGPCFPVVYLNGTRLINGADLEEMIHPASVRRIEAYHRGVALPAEFASNRECGVLAIWTGPRRRP
ncbi:MAG TPA: carboxypeptidase-like regulatory domain-containing protein [Gemmatimonadaceae bacterium]